MKKVITVTLTLLSGLSFVTATPIKASAKTYQTTPKSLRGYYIGKGDLVQITKKHFHLGAPQAGILPYKVKHINKTGKTYHVYAYAEMSRTSVKFTFTKSGKHHLKFNKRWLHTPTITKVSHNVYNSYSANPFHGLPKGVH